MGFPAKCVGPLIDLLSLSAAASKAHIFSIYTLVSSTYERRGALGKPEKKYFIENAAH